MNRLSCIVFTIISVAFFSASSSAQVIDCACESEFSVGDRVVLLEDLDDGSGLLAGATGTVICGTGSSPPLLVDWDDFNTGHNGNGFCYCGETSGTGTSNWFVHCSQVAFTFTVDDDGLDFPGADFDNIQDAVDAASDGDEILVYPGTYTSAGTVVVQLANKSIVLASAGGAEVTLIDGQNVRRGLETWGSGNTSQIAGFTFVNGYDSVQAGGVFLGSGNQHLIDCRIVNCSAGSQGGGLGSQSSHAVIESCTFEDNTAPFGGAVDSSVSGGSSTMSFINCAFLDNQAEWEGGLPQGGAVYVQGNPNSTSFTGCTFSGNTAYYGGAFSRDNPTAYATITTFTDCSFESNRAYLHGGAVSLLNCNTAFENCAFANNDNMMDPEIEGWGGGMFCNDSSPSLVSCTFSGNGSSLVGGAMIAVGALSSPQIVGCTFEGNTAVWGGGLYCSFFASPSLTNCTISGNLASDSGGGVFAYASAVTMTNCTLRGNSAISSDVSQNYGGAMYNRESDTVLTGCIIEDNTSGSGGGIYNEWSDPVLEDCTISSNVAKVCGGGMFSEDSIAWLTGTTFCANLPDNIIGAWVDQGGNELSSTCGDDDGLGLCPGDTNTDYDVDVLDLLYVIAVWGTDNPAGDINRDGWVDVMDLLEVIGNWGTCNE